MLDENGHKFTGVSDKDAGLICWYKDGRLHRDDGPAMYAKPSYVEMEGNEIWYQCGEVHRDDGPAMILPGNYNIWFRHGKKHRLDGPAKILGECSQESQLEFYVNGFRFDSSHKWQQAVDRWLSYKEVTREEIALLIGNFRIVEWE